MAYLAQNPEFSEHLTIRDYIFNQDNELLGIIKEYEQLLESGNYDAHGEKYQHLLNKMDALNAWDYEAQIKQILGKLGIHDLDAYTDELSGGQRQRVAGRAEGGGRLWRPGFLPKRRIRRRRLEA